MPEDRAQPHGISLREGRPVLSADQAEDSSALPSQPQRLDREGVLRAEHSAESAHASPSSRSPDADLARALAAGGARGIDATLTTARRLDRIAGPPGRAPAPSLLPRRGYGLTRHQSSHRTSSGLCAPESARSGAAFSGSAHGVSPPPPKLRASRVPLAGEASTLRRSVAPHLSFKVKNDGDRAVFRDKGSCRRTYAHNVLMSKASRLTHAFVNSVSSRSGLLAADSGGLRTAGTVAAGCGLIAKA
jgi:hypothetical protein